MSQLVIAAGHSGWTVAGGIIGALFVIGILFNLHDIIRYIRISRM